MQDVTNNRTFKLIRAVGEVVRRHRKAHCKTMYGLSAEIAMSKSTWREVEIGACKDIKLTTLWKIAEGLEISAGDLLNEVSQDLGEDFSLTDLN